MTTALEKTGYFNIERDIEIEKAGGFFCEACLEDKPLDDISPDPRYCQWCYDFLTKEATQVTSFVRPKWVPKEKPPDKIVATKPQKINKGRGSLQNAPLTPPNAISKGDIIHNKGKPLTSAKKRIMHTKKSPKTEIQPPVAKVTYRKRGPKLTSMPEDLIRRWAGEGMGTKAIVARLKNERDIKVHHSTIQRLLSGQRVLV